MSTAALETAMADMVTARATFEAKASRVGDEVERLQETVNAANTKAHGERVHIADGERKRRRRRAVPPPPRRRATTLVHTRTPRPRRRSATMLTPWTSCCRRHSAPWSAPMPRRRR